MHFFAGKKKGYLRHVLEAGFLGRLHREEAQPKLFDHLREAPREVARRHEAVLHLAVREVEGRLGAAFFSNAFNRCYLLSKKGQHNNGPFTSVSATPICTTSIFKF